MIIHSPVISGSLTFADGATFTLPDNGVYSGSFSGSIQTAGDLLTIDDGTFASFSSSVSSSIGGISTDFADFSGNVTASAISASGLIESSQIKVDDITLVVGTNNIVSIGSGSGTNPFGFPDQGLYVNSSAGNTSGFITLGTSGVSKASLYSYAGTFFVQAYSGEDLTLYADGGNKGLNLGANGTASIDMHFEPDANVTYDLGSPTKRWRDLYLDGTTLNLGGKKIKATPTTIKFVDENDAPITTVAAAVEISGSSGTTKLTTDSSGNITVADSGSGAPKSITVSEIKVSGSAGEVTLAVSSEGNLDTTTQGGTKAASALSGSFTGSFIGNILSTNGVVSGSQQVIDLLPTGTVSGSSQVLGGTSIVSGSQQVIDFLPSGVVSSSAITYSGNDVTVLGDLTVQGDTTTLNTATLSVEDLNITMASGAGSAAAANGAGITVAGASATLTYTSTGDKWVFNKVVDVPTSGILINGTAVTSTAAELNLLDTATAGTITNSKAVIYGAAGEVNATTLQIGGTSITATATELNQLDGNTVGGTTAGDIADIDSTQTFTNKTWNGVAIAHDYIGLDAIDGTNISDNAINSEHYTDGSIDRVHLAADIVDGTKIADDAINSEHIADGAVDNVHLAGSIAASKITEISNLTAAEGAQLENIGTTTISATQWGYLGAMNQGVTTSSNVTFGNINGATGTFTGDVIAYSSSDEKLKDNIELISNPIAKIKSLKGVTWTWNDNADEVQKSLPNVGVIAQDVERVLPQLVTDRDNGFKAVDYAKLTGLLIEAIKEQQKEIEALKSRLI